MSAQVITLPSAAGAVVQNPPRRGRLPKSVPTLIHARVQKFQKQQALREVEKSLELALRGIDLHAYFLPKLEAEANQYRAEIARLTGRAPLPRNTTRTLTQ